LPVSVLRARKKPPRNWRKWGLALFFWLAAIPSQAEERQHRLIEPGSAGSALPAARALLEQLAAGKTEEAAALSNAPQRRYEVLADYRAAVGEDQFKRVFKQYFVPENRVIAEVALGPRRLLIWELGEAGKHLAGQYYVEVDQGVFLMDDLPSEQRSKLRQVLESYRKDKQKSGSERDYQLSVSVRVSLPVHTALAQVPDWPAPIVPSIV
jgi:hypothetical protein